jgi:hypothetical protein
VNDDDVKKRLRLYRADPVLFVREVIGAQPDKDQQQILMAMAAPGAHVSVRSGHGIGKSCVEAWLILWFLCLFRDCRIPVTAPTSHQLFDVMWSEIAKWRAVMHPWFRAMIVQTSDRLYIEGAEKTMFSVARTSRKDQPEALQGFHATNLLFVCDEASGIPDEVFQVAEGALSGAGSRIILMGNPTRSDGYFFETHTKDRKNWTTFAINSENSPRADKTHIQRMADKYGRDSNIYRVRVLGEFPTSSDDTLIQLDWCESAIGRDISVTAAFKRIAGLDVARFGDDSCALAVRSGPILRSMEEWRQKDLMTTVGKVVQAYREKRAFDIVYVDAIGMGAGVVDRLKEQGIPCFAVNVAESPSMQGRFNRLRDELWWACREWFREKGCRIDPAVNTPDPVTLENLGSALLGELTQVRYAITSSGKIQIESKDDMKKRGLASPNLADALCLTFAAGPATPFENSAPRQIVVNRNVAW